jgi:hypothetical protein
MPPYQQYASNLPLIKRTTEALMHSTGREVPQKNCVTKVARYLFHYPSFLVASYLICYELIISHFL